MPIFVNNDEMTTEYVSTNELIDFIIKQEMIIQDLMAQSDVIDQRKMSLINELMSAKRLHTDAYKHLTTHLAQTAMRRRHS